MDYNKIAFKIAQEALSQIEGNPEGAYGVARLARIAIKALDDAANEKAHTPPYADEMPRGKFSMDIAVRLGADLERIKLIKAIRTRFNTSLLTTKRFTDPLYDAWAAGRPNAVMIQCDREETLRDLRMEITGYGVVCGCVQPTDHTKGESHA